MRYGIITDIHSNLTALRAVLRQLDRMIATGSSVLHAERIKGTPCKKQYCQ